MGVLISLCDGQEILLDRLLSQVRRYRGDQTDKALALVVNHASTGINSLELSNRHPLVLFKHLPSTVQHLEALHFMLSTALQEYQEENYFLWVEPKTYLTQPPRIQIAQRCKWSGAVAYWVQYKQVHSNSSKYPVPLTGYVVLERTFMERALKFVEENGEAFHVKYFSKSELSLIPVTSTNDVLAAYLGYIAYVLDEPLDTSLQGMVSAGAHLNKASFNKLAQLGNTKNL